MRLGWRSAANWRFGIVRCRPTTRANAGLILQRPDSCSDGRRRFLLKKASGKPLNILRAGLILQNRVWRKARARINTETQGSKSAAMAETLGSLADKLITVKLKLCHTEDAQRTQSLTAQEKQLQDEINEFLSAAFSGQIPIERLTFSANKVYKKDGNAVPELRGTIGQIFSQLAETNTRLWHIQEKVYEFESIPVDQKDEVIKQLAIVNLERNQCIDKLDEEFQRACLSRSALHDGE